MGKPKQAPHKVVSVEYVEGGNVKPPDKASEWDSYYQ